MDAESNSSPYRSILNRFRELEKSHSKLTEELEVLVRSREVEEERERRRMSWNINSGGSGASPAQKVLQSMGIAVHVCRAFDGKIIFWNRTAETLYGWKEYEALGQKATELIKDEQYHSSIEKILESSMPNQSWSGQFPFKKRSGEIFTALVNKSPLYEDGELVGVITVSSDAAVFNIINDGTLRTYEDPTHAQSKEWKFNVKKFPWQPKTQVATVSQISSSVSNLASKVFAFRNGDDDACSACSSNKEREDQNLDIQDVDSDKDSSRSNKLWFGKNSAEGNNTRKEESILGFVQPSKIAAKFKEKLNIKGGNNTSEEECKIVSPCGSTGIPERISVRNGSNHSRDSSGTYLNLHNALINRKDSYNDQTSKDEYDGMGRGYNGAVKKESAAINDYPFVTSWLECYGSPGGAFEGKTLHQKPEVSQSPTVSSPAESNSSHECSSSKEDRELDLIDECEIRWEDLHLGDEIGHGSYATVYRGNWNGSDVAVKVYNENDYRESTLLDYKKEIGIMKRLRHPNVLLFMGAVYSPERLAIVTEFLPRGSLFRTLHKNSQNLDLRRRLRMSLDVARGMNYLHRRNPPIIHRDLKSSNLLVDRNWTVKVGDFGLSKWKNATYVTAKSGRGTPQWMAPEVLRNEPSNEKSDVYSFGVILWELVTSSIPWSEMNSLQVVGVVGFMDQRLDMPETMDPQLSALIKDCWDSDPERRPSFHDLIQRMSDLIRALSATQARKNLPPEE